jgi:uncharacterized protein YbaR (Trm112 family)
VLAGLLAWQNFQQTELTMKPKILHKIIDEEPVLVCPDCKVPLEEDWIGNDRDPENWRLVGLVCPKCYRLFEIAEAVIDMDDVPF